MKHRARTIDFETLYKGLNDRVASGSVTEARDFKNPNLRLYTYSRDCAYDKLWDEISLLARGLIIDVENRKVVATPWEKFFNAFENGESIPDEPFRAYEKVDGSLIIVFHDGIEWRMVTKGSFWSEQAQWAQKWFKDKDLSHLTPGSTYLFEAVYPENRIVVNYAKPAMVLLGGYNADGLEYSDEQLRLIAKSLNTRVAHYLPFDSVADMLTTAETLPITQEGFVVRFESGKRIKIKGEEYLRVHRLVSHLTPLGVWEYMKNGDNLSDIRKELPEEFHQDYDNILSLLFNEINGIVNEVRLAAKVLKNLEDKEVGLISDKLSPNVKKFIFAYRKANGNLLANDKARNGLFRAIRPTSNILPGYHPSSFTTRFQDEEF